MFSQNNTQQQQQPSMQGGLFGGVNTQQQPSLFGQPQAQTGGLFSNPQQQQGQTGGLFGAQTQSTGQAQQQASSGGLFGNKQQGTAAAGGAGSLFGSSQQQQQGQTPPNLLFGGQQQQATSAVGNSLLQQQSQPSAGTSTTLFGGPQQQQGQPTTAGASQSLFGGASQQQQQQSTTPASQPLFGGPQQQQQQSTTAGTTQSSLFGGQQQQPGAPTSGGLFGNPPSQQQPSQPQQSGLFSNPQQPKQETTQLTQPKQGGLLFGQQTQTQAPPAQQGGLFGATNAQQPNTDSTQAKSTPGSLFGGTLSEASNTQKPTQQPAGGLFGTSSAQTPNLLQPSVPQQQQQNSQQQDQSQKQAPSLFPGSATTQQKPPSTQQTSLFQPSANTPSQQNPIQSQQTSSTPNQVGAPSGSSQTAPPKSDVSPISAPPSATGGLFGSQPTKQTQSDGQSGPFQNNNKAPSSDKALPTPSSTPNPLFGAGQQKPAQPASTTQQPQSAATNPPVQSTSQPQPQSSLFGGNNQTANPSKPPSSSLFGSTPQPAPQLNAPAGPALKPKEPATQGNSENVPLFKSDSQPPTDQTQKLSNPPTQPAGNNKDGNIPNKSTGLQAPQVQTQKQSGQNVIPISKKAQTQASGSQRNEQLEQEINNAKKLNGSLHMFCQNIHKYKKEDVETFFSDKEIVNKLSQTLSQFRPEQNSEEWEKIRNDAKKGLTPLVFWNERLTKYKYQYLLVMIIEDLAEYLQLRPTDCHNYFNIFLSQESKLVDLFFDPSSGEPCIEFFYEQQALTYDQTNVSIRKESPFIANLRTSVMQDMYFHERNCILGSIRLLLLMTQEQKNYSVVKNLLDGLLNQANGLEKSLWELYKNPIKNKNLSTEDSELFSMQLQFEQDQIMKLLYIITQNHKGQINTSEYLNVFAEQNFLGDLKSLSPPGESNSFENKNKMNGFASVVGDSCLMLMLIKAQKDKQPADLKELLHKHQSNPYMNILQLAYESSDKIFRLSSYNQIEYFYKAVTRILSYKNIGILKIFWQKIFFEIIFKIISGLYDSNILDQNDQQEALISECLSRALAKTLHKNGLLIDNFWNKLEDNEVSDQFRSCFKSSISLYKIMKNAMGSSSDPKAEKIIIFLSSNENFSWFQLYQQVQIWNQTRRDDNLILKLRLISKLICVDPKCILLLQLAFSHEYLTAQIFEDYIQDCKGDQIIQFLILTMTIGYDQKQQSQNFFCGLKALNALLSNHQHMTQLIIQQEKNQEHIINSYKKIIFSLGDADCAVYKLKAKREILSLLYIILRDFEEPLLAFSRYDRNVEYDSQLLSNLFIFYLSLVEEWDQNLAVFQLKHKWKIGQLIMKITENCLHRLKMNVRKKTGISSIQKDSYTNQFLSVFLVPILKKARVEEIIMKILEVSANSSSLNGNYGVANNKSVRLCNKYWQTYVQNSTFKFREFQIEQIKSQSNLRDLIADTFALLETVLQLMEEKFTVRKLTFEQRNLQKAVLLDELPILDYFERIFCKTDCIFHYKQEYYSDKAVDALKVNVLYALSSYLSFDNHFFSSVDEINPTLPFYLYSLLDKEAALINSIGDDHLLYDYNAIRNPICHANSPDGSFCNSINALCLRVLTQIMLVWESSQSIRKPILVDFLSNMNMENYWEKLNYSSGNTHLTSFISEMFNILKKNEVFLGRQIDLFNKALSDDSSAVIDFMLTSLYTQPLFMNMILKSESLDRTKKRDYDLKIRFKRFFESKSASVDQRLLNKYLNLLAEIFKRDTIYPSFCQEFRSGTQELFQTITQIVVQNFKPYELDQLVERDLQLLVSPKEPIISAFEFQKFKMATLLREQVNHSELNRHMLCLHNFQTLLDLVAKEYLSKKLKSVQSIQSSLKIIFEHQQIIHILSSLGKFTPNLGFEVWNPPQEMEKEEQPGKGKIFKEAFYQLLEQNEYGYGNQYAQDGVEQIFNVIDNEKAGDYINRANFILFRIVESRQKSLKWSIEEIKTRAFDSWIRLFNLIASSGSEGYAMSTVSSALPSFTIRQLKERKIIKEHDQLCLLYPNYEIEFVSNFVNIFSQQSNSQCVSHLSNLLNDIMRQLLADIKRGFFGQLLDQKTKLFLSIMHALRHLQDLEASEISKDADKEKPNNIKIEDKLFFSNTYSKQEGEDHLKFLTQILEEAIARESKIQLCDFIQGLFLQLQIVETIKISKQNQDRESNLNQYYAKLIGILMNLFSSNVDGMPIVVSCLSCIFKLNPQFFLSMFASQIKALECLLHKIFFEKNETAQIFVSVISLLKDIASIPEGAQLLSEAGLVSILNNTPLFKGIENEPFYWQNGERNLLHSFWCWTLSLFQEYLMNVPSDLENTFASMQFLQTYFTRIGKILSIPQVLQAAGTSIAATSKIASIEHEKLSLAYMEELEQIVEVLSVFFCQSNLFKRKMSNDFEQILQVLTHCTIFLFKQGLLLHSVFMPVSKMEKKLSNIYDCYSSSSLDASHLFTSMQTPSQTPSKQDSDYISTALTEAQNKNFNLFIIQIELHYQNILFSLYSCIADGLQESSLLQMFQYSTNSFIEIGKSAAGNEPSQIYSVNYWASFAASLLDSLKFVDNALNKWDSKKNRNVNMDAQLEKLSALSSSVEYNLCSYSFGSQSFLGQNSKSILQTAQLSLHQIILVAIKHFQLFNDFKAWFGQSLNNNLSDLFAKLNTKLEAMKKYDNADKTLNKAISDSIQLFNTMQPLNQSRF